MENISTFKDPDYIQLRITDIYPKCKLILFDLDGTLFNHNLFVFERIIYCLRKYYLVEDLEVVYNQLHNRIIKHGTDAILDFVCEQVLPSVDKNLLLSALRESEPPISHSYFRKNTFSVFSKLKENFALAICTNGNKSQQMNKTKSLFSILGFEIPVHFCIESEPKPSPVCLRLALTSFSEKESLFIGDTSTDELAAAKAEIAFMHIKELITN